MEYCSSSLADILEAQGRCFTEVQIGAVLAGTIEGLRYLHGLNQIHRDVKAGNLLLSARGVIKLADFGVSARLGHTLSRRGTVIGTPFWMAPEVISGGPESGYNSKADVWSLGITAIELAEGRPPNSDMHPMRAIFQIPTQPPPRLQKPDAWSRDFNGAPCTRTPPAPAVPTAIRASPSLPSLCPPTHAATHAANTPPRAASPQPWWSAAW